MKQLTAKRIWRRVPTVEDYCSREDFLIVVFGLRHPRLERLMNETDGTKKMEEQRLQDSTINDKGQETQR